MRSPRMLHPGAWWIWAIGCAVAASRTTNPLVLTLLVVASAVVVYMRRPNAPWSGSFRLFLRMGLAIIVLRVALQVAFSAGVGTTVLVPLPGISLPDWLAGIRLGGDITAEALLAALYDGMRLAAIIICLGAANALASPTRLLKSVPAALYELGVSLVVALTFVPQLAADVERVQSARRLRGRPTRGLRALAGSAMPVLEGALDRSVTLASAMDSRGYGRSRHLPDSHRHAMAAALLIGLVAVCLGVFGLLSTGTASGIAVTMVSVGCLACLGATWWAGRSRVRTSYRRDPWALAEWCVFASGVATAGAFVMCGFASSDLITSTFPPSWPALPIAAALGCLIAATPAWTAPAPPAASRTTMAPSTRVPAPA